MTYLFTDKHTHTDIQTEGKYSLSLKRLRGINQALFFLFFFIFSPFLLFSSSLASPPFSSLLLPSPPFSSLLFCCCFYLFFFVALSRCIRVFYVFNCFVFNVFRLHCIYQIIYSFILAFFLSFHLLVCFFFIFTQSCSPW